MNAFVLVLTTALGTIVVAVIGLLTAKLAQRGAAAQVAVSERNLVLESYDRLNDDLARRNDQLNATNDKLRDRLELVEAAEAETRLRVTELEVRRTNDRQSIAVLVAYTRTLVALLTENGIPVPEAPPDVLFGN